MKKSPTPLVPIISEQLKALLDQAGDDDVIDIGEYTLVKVVTAEYQDEYKILISFSDETQQAVDFGPFLNKLTHPVYSKYKKLALFKKFKIESGNIVWGRDWDLIFPIDQLYAGKID